MRAAAAKASAGAAVSLTAGSGWSPLGPAPFASNSSSAGYALYGPVSGRATAVAIDPADPSGNTVLVGGANGGLWRSTNAGSAGADPGAVQWTPLIDNQPSLAVGAIGVQPQPQGSENPANSLLLVGTGETNSSTDSYYGQGILRGIPEPAQNGWTWKSITNAGAHSFLGLGFSQIAFSTDHVNVVVAAAAGSSLGLIEGLASSPAADLGLYYSVDAGLTWNYSNITDSGTTISPSSATAVIYNQATQQFFAFVRRHGIYASNAAANWPTAGVTWSRLMNQPGMLAAASCPANTSPGCPIYRGELAVVPGRNEMYAWYVDANDFDQRIWLSVDAGNSWQQVSTTSIDSCGDLLGGCGTQDGSYNLTLAAVPDGAGNTDLYAGAVNIYKCEITGLPASPSACDGTETLGYGFLNLTHVYGCAPDLGAPAHVHPSQHGMDFLVVNGGSQAAMYFANDGGIYRSLDGYTELTSGACDAANGFDNLNPTLGSMTQFVSLAQDPADASTLLGGAQGNGFPATSQALLNSSWGNVNTGPGGYAEINPANPSEWFTSTGGVNIQTCGNGAGCHVEDFAAGLVVSSSTLGGDDGPVDAPFVLDPAILSPGGVSDLIVGTCRVWRGSTDGSGFTALSPDFDTLSNDSICGGSEVNLVRSLAAGGPLDATGGSSMIYAGTDGWGPLVTTNPPGGHLWATDPNNGPGAWIDRSGLGAKNINPEQFPISAVLVDDSDPSGQSAYAAIAGFAASRIWTTATAGVVWTDLTLNLPVAPVNALAIDPGPAGVRTLYAGTDVGVFSLVLDPNATQPPVWAEVGPAPGSGQSVYLPNVPVMALRIFTDGTTELLRAATYGRGVWQYVLTATPDFLLSVPLAEQTAFVSQTATFSGALTAVNGYTSPVSLTCVAGLTLPPTICSSSPALVQWNDPASNPAASFTITASAPAGDYYFSLRAVGNDAKSVTRNAALVLHAVDFGLTAPSPASVSLNRSGTSGTISFQVTAAGSFKGTVALSCNGLPPGAACNFSPTGPVTPSAAHAVPLNLDIGSTAEIPTGIFPVAIVATTPGGPQRTQNISLNVTANQDYALTISNPTISEVVGTPVTYNGTLTALNDYGSVVNLSCVASLPASSSCTVSPASLTPSDSGAAFTVTASGSSAPQTYTFSINAAGTDASSIAHSQSVTLNSTFDFNFTASPSSQAVLAGGTGTYTLDLNPLGGPAFPSAVTFSPCSGLPPLTTCTLSPPEVAAGSPKATVTVTITTTAPVLAAARSARWPIASCGLLLLGLALTGMGRRAGRAGLQVCILLAATAGLATSCGGGASSNLSGGGSPGTPTGTSTVTVTATCGAVAHAVQLTLMVQ
jgi:large repetitive protein